MIIRMRFADYDISLKENGDIELDEGLTLRDLGLVNHQALKVELINNKVTFKKLDHIVLVSESNGHRHNS